MKNTIVRTGLAVVAAAAVAFGLSACGDSKESSTSGSTGSQSAAVSETTGEESEAFIADMKDAVQIVNDKIAEQPDMAQIMIASDVDKPTQKYGMWVMPYKPSEAVKTYTMSIQIENGKDFVVTAVSAKTGKTWTMDQAGTMTEVTETD